MNDAAAPHRPAHQRGDQIKLLITILAREGRLSQYQLLHIVAPPPPQTAQLCSVCSVTSRTPPAIMAHGALAVTMTRVFSVIVPARRYYSIPPSQVSSSAPAKLTDAMQPSDHVSIAVV